MTDIVLYCRDCNQEFTFTTGEQEFYASKGLINQPSRCAACRAARKASSSSSVYINNYNSRNDYHEPRQMYSATCASCGSDTQVPFEPRADRAVYCSNCYQPQRNRDRSPRY